jgi:hypothetical protein
MEALYPQLVVAEEPPLQWVGLRSPEKGWRQEGADPSTVQVWCGLKLGRESIGTMQPACDFRALSASLAGASDTSYRRMSKPSVQ